MEDKKKPMVIELLIDENDDATGVDFISFVEFPAIERDFMYFNQDKKAQYSFKSTDEDKRLVTGPAMIPDENIIRYDAFGEPFFVFFSKDSVAKAQEIFFKDGNHKQSNLEHETKVKDVTVIESWIIESDTQDKAFALGFEALPVGTWMVTYKVDNDAVWEMVKNGEVLGFSAEGVFGQNFTKFTQLPVFDEINTILKSDISDEEKYDLIKSKVNTNK